MNHHPYSERGAAPGLEAVMVAGVVTLIIAFIVIAAQVALAKDAVANAAASAARAASQERGPQQAADVARDIALSTLDGSSLECVDPAVSTDSSGFSVPAGTPAQVTVTVSCTATRSYMGILNAGSRVYSHTSSSPIDTYRQRVGGGIPGR